MSWCTGGILLGVIEVISLPSDPNYSTLLQISPLFLLIGGIWFILSEYQKVSSSPDDYSRRLKMMMIIGWVALFGVDAGVASVNNMSTQIFRSPLPYYFQGISIAQKVIALSGIFILGGASISAERQEVNSEVKPRLESSVSFWEKPVTTIGFIALLLGVVLGLAQYWFAVVFAGFIILLGGTILYPIGRMTEKNVSFFSDDEEVEHDEPESAISSRRTSSDLSCEHALGKPLVRTS